MKKKIIIKKATINDWRDFKEDIINKKKYKFRQYSKLYPILFEREKNKILKALGKDIKIEHVGSTSIPGLGGKSIIDIAIRTPRNKIKIFKRKIEGLGYKYSSDHPASKNSIFLQKIIKCNDKERRVHVHLVLNDPFWKTFIVFRNYLRVHDKERDKYARLKKDAVKFADGEAKKYRECKKRYLEITTKKALGMKEIN